VIISPFGDALITFLEGWQDGLEGDATSPHRWSTSSVARIQISKISPSAIGTTRFELTFDAIPFLPKSGPGFQDVIVFLDGLLLTAIRFYDADPKFAKGNVNIPNFMSPFSLLSFYFPNSMSQQRVGEGPDERQLGIGLKRLELSFS
jgi:hypothetical protein